MVLVADTEDNKGRERIMYQDHMWFIGLLVVCFFLGGLLHLFI